MRSLCMALVFAAAVGAGVPARAAEPAREWSQTDVDELNGIANTHIELMGTEVLAARNLVLADHVEACVHAKQAQLHADATSKAIIALRDRIRAEGKDTAPLVQVDGQMADVLPKIPAWVDSICDVEGQQVEIGLLLGYFQQFMASTHVVTQAKALQGQPQACQKLPEASAAMNRFEAHVAHMKAKYGSDREVVAELEKFNLRAANEKAHIVRLTADCPAQ